MPEALHAGRDPLDARESEKAAQRRAAEAKRVAEARKTTFTDCAKAYISAHERAWKSAPHASQWQASLRDYVHPIFGDLPVEAIDTTLVLKALRPIWTEKTVTASRVRGRIESVLDWARVQGLRDGENPARWRGHLDKLLPNLGKRPESYSALPYTELPAFMAALKVKEGNAARALEFAILTAARSAEVRGAPWDEFDLRLKLWTIPAKRMKASAMHRVPLSGPALAIVEAMATVQEGALVFPGVKAGKPLSRLAMMRVLHGLGYSHVTVHGFRSTFRDWAAEKTHYPREVAEAALAHTNKNKVEASYLRSDFLEQRRSLMEAWANFAYRLPGEDVIEAKFGTAG